METQDCSFSLNCWKIWKARKDLFTTRINKQLDIFMFWHPETRSNGYQCLLSYLEQQWFLHVPPFSLVGWMLVTIYRDKANAVVVLDLLTHTGTYWYLQDLLYFWLSLRNVTLPHKISKYHLVCKKKRERDKVIKS